MHGDETPARMKEKDNLKISLGQHRGFIAYFTFNFWLTELLFAIVRQISSSDLTNYI